MNNVEKLSKLLTETPKTYVDYLKCTIIETVFSTSDENMLTYIHTMLSAAVTAEKRKAKS